MTYAEAVETISPVRVERFNVGCMTAAAGIWRSGDDFDRQVRVPVSAYLIDVGDERVLVDTGLNPGAVEDASEHYGVEGVLDPFALEQEASISEQVDLETVTKVVLTHLHFDHAGGLAQLPASIRVVVQRREWEAGQDEAAIERNFFMPLDYEPVADRVELVDGDHDLFGDGSIRLLLTPGHTPGHQSVRVGERLTLGADVGHYESSLDDHLFPPFGWDLEVQAESAKRLRALRDEGCLVVPGHDPDVLEPGPVPV